MKEVLPSNYDLSEVHIIGNGPSAVNFNYTTGTIICFHKPIVNCDIVCTQGYRVGIEGYWGKPFITTCTLYLPNDKNFAKWLYLKKSSSYIENNHFCYKWSVYQLCSGNKHNYITDSGQRAYLWAIHNGAKKIHLWGFDNIWSTEEIYITNNPVHNIFYTESSYVSDKKFLDKRIYWKSILQPNTEIHK